MSMRHRRQEKNSAVQDAVVMNVAEAVAIPFAQRLSCTIAEACQVTGLGRTKLYELIAEGHLATTTIGRRRLVLVRSLLSLLQNSSPQPSLRGREIVLPSVTRRRLRPDLDDACQNSAACVWAPRTSFA